MQTTEFLGTATYSPDDNKLRFYPFARLSKEDYERARRYGFIWAPKQELFVSPAWNPSREDLLIQWCGEIGDDDKSLTERAEERAERFEDYSERRAEDADRAHSQVESIAGNIPLGQPILVGHHSEKRARKDAEKIENGMRQAVKMWETSKYWERRAAGAIRHAKYKEVPAVRARRIKTIEADKRKTERDKKHAEMCLKFWSGELKLVNKATGAERVEEVTTDRARWFCNLYDHSSFDFPLSTYPRTAPASQYEGTMSLWGALGGSDGDSHAVCTLEQAKNLALRVHGAELESCNRWLAHYENRLAYERAMLADGGGLAAEKFNLCVGGRVLLRDEWYPISKVNLREGKPISVSVIGYFRAIQVEEIKEYKPPQEGDFEKVNAVTKLPPICNYPGKQANVARLEGSEKSEHEFKHITQAEWDGRHADYKGTRIVEAEGKYGRHRVRYGQFGSNMRYVPVYIIDAKRKDPPQNDGTPSPVIERQKEFRASHTRAQVEKSETEQKIEGLRGSLQAGVKAISANQLFPTPDPIVRQMIKLAGILAGCRILEPSAGTGNIISGITRDTGFECCRVVAVEINSHLCQTLEEQRGKTLYANDANFEIHCKDFLQCNGDLGQFSVILMNPPFENANDIKHILHAVNFLRPGGRLVAVCANGPRQQEQLKPLATEWIDLEPGSFKESGTNVNTALMLIKK